VGVLVVLAVAAAAFGALSSSEARAVGIPVNQDCTAHSSPGSFVYTCSFEAVLVIEDTSTASFVHHCLAGATCTASSTSHLDFSGDPGVTTSMTLSDSAGDSSSTSSAAPLAP
jgi:hypothetical protein